MNSFVSVEDVPCEELENLVFSSSNISDYNLGTCRKDVNFVNFTNKNISSSDSATLIPDDYIVCMTDSEVNENTSKSETDFGSGEKLDHNLLSVAQTKFELETGVCNNTKLIPVNVEENYNNCDAVDFEYLPFETVLMNYPGEVDYLDLHDKFQNIKFGNSPNPFESDNEAKSFDGFSDSSSSFEGFNQSKSKLKSFKQSSKQAVNLKNQSNSKSKLLQNQFVKNKERPRSRSTDTDSRRKHNTKNKSGRHSIDNSQYLKSSEEKSKNIGKTLAKDCDISKLNFSPVFGYYKVTPLSSRAKGSDIKTSRLNLPLESTPSRPSLNRARSITGVKSETPKSFQNYSESAAISFCSSGTSKFKEKINESTGGMQQKGKKEKLNISIKGNDQNQDETIDDWSDLFPEDSNEDESFEGFMASDVIISNIKEESVDLDEFIGPNCQNIDCTISWLESKQAKSMSQNINNGIVYELSEFAKKIAWEPEFVADWICRLKGYLNMKVADEDMRKINSVLKRRKAITINFSGKHLLKTKLSSFDYEEFNLPCLENINKYEDNYNSSFIKSDSKAKNLNSGFKQKQIKKRKSNENSTDVDKYISNSNSEEPLSYADDKVISPQLSSCDKVMENANIPHKDDITKAKISDDDDIDNLEMNNSSDLELSDSELSDFSDNDINVKKSASTNLPSTEYRMSSRIRKPTTKAQESYSRKFILTLQSNDSNENNSSQSENSSDILKPKFLNHTFIDDGKEIGPNCSTNSINIQLLNSVNETSYPITNGVVYELYHFFRERKASLTSLVHTLYRLKKIPFDKSHIIATMAKIHEMVKVMWKENFNKNPNMPYEEFSLLVSVHLDNKTRNQRSRSTLSNDSEENTKNISPDPEPLCKKRRISSSLESISKKLSSKRLESVSNSESSIVDASQEVSSTNNSFDLNSTKGYEGKITRGDIVYLYTKWLKKKMEGQSNVFVTDLSKQVEELINERKVECIRIPVGTLMSSSVQLFDEFRKLSRVNMLQAKKYLLEDWIEDINSKLDSKVKKKSISEQPAESNQENKGSNQSILHNTKNKSKDVSMPVENNKSKENISKESEHLSKQNNSKDYSNLSNENISKVSHSNTLKSGLPNLSDDHEVEKIVGYRIVKIGEESITEYRIRWVGCTSKDDSWINESDLNCPDILAKFWEALNKQRALKGKPEPEPSKQYVGTLKEPTVNIAPTSTQPGNNLLEKQLTASNPSVIQQTSNVKEKKSSKTFINGQENISPFFGRENGSQNFFNIMINSLKPDLVDYQHEEEESPFIKRIKVNKGDVLQIYDEWRCENQEHLLTGGNQKVDVNVLKARVKDLMESKKVRNFNPSCIIDSCYRMALMRAKLKDVSKIKEYLAGDFMEFMQISQKHQDFVRNDYSSKLKKLKQSKANTPSEYDKISIKINTISNLERETLIMAKYLDINKNASERELEDKVSVLQKSLQAELKDKTLVENIKKQNSHTIKELESYGVTDNTMDELLNIALKLKM